MKEPYLIFPFFPSQSIKHTALISRDHVLDVDEGIFSTSLFQQFQSLWNQVTQIMPLSLIVLHLVPNVCVVIPEYIEDRKNLSVIRNQRLPNHLSTQHQFLNYLQHRRYNIWIPGVQSSCITTKITLNWNDQLRNNW